MENQHVDAELDEMTAQELADRKEEMKKYFEDSVPYLEAQLKHETLLTSIDEQRFKRAQLGVQYAMLMQNMQEAQEHNYAEGNPEEEKSVNPETKERKLKKN
jgi:hypothetical protein